ncbi:hypothetical protein RFI_14895 [Reticulomyxa filosa]|uniref:Anaphase-promoting complex subunit 10 n=1 Tax=Reticulomyxa filosa TaxID=46433 RepID=X6N8S4_RETFI|nr:hypothetical protein RFI_14895 [Reticulomyxa filosa]|eukprot:ETO22303.1 hypothetical protein RFI_14895 [Reticulomyxa filosa]
MIYTALAVEQKTNERNKKRSKEKDDTNNGSLREIGDEALVWKLSSAKAGHGVQQLRDNNLDTFWQSDGVAPHTITVLFNCKIKIERVDLFTKYQLDESYTPKEIVIYAYTGFYEKQIVSSQTLHEPNGWVQCKLSAHHRQGDENECLKTNRLEICIMSSHQNGRDTHVRQIKIYSPKTDQNVISSSCGATCGNNKKTNSLDLHDFGTINFLQFDSLR